MYSRYLNLIKSKDRSQMQDSSVLHNHTNDQNHLFTFKDSIIKIDQIHSIRLVSGLSNHRYYEDLLKLTYIIVESLFDMKPNQIHSSVFSSQNQKLLLFRRDQLIGGLSFRSIPKRYTEIELMSIKKDLQSKGYGSLLINALKHLLQLRSISLLVTHADNQTLYFYYRHGFSQQTYINNEIWTNRDIEYKNSTKLQCLVFPTINYFFLRDKLKEQKKYFQSKQEINFSVSSEKTNK